MAKLFGFEIKRASEEYDNAPSIIEKSDDDGAVTVTATGGAYGTYLDMDGTAKNEADLVTRYREMANHAEVETALDDIVNEAVIVADNEAPISLNLDTIEMPDRIKDLIRNEFTYILRLLDFSNRGYDIFNRWYVDGRIKYHVIIDPENPKEGIKEVRYIDPRKLRKVREVVEKTDDDTGAPTKQTKTEYFVYNESGFGSQAGSTKTGGGQTTTGIKIAKDAIVEATSGILNENNSLILSHLHKAVKPLNQLRMLEDASVIYRITRAPERRVFYIDVGNLPKMKAEQYLRDMMVKHKNRLVYDAQTGEVRDDRKHMTMMEDFWLPRREGGKGTEISTLQVGQNLGEMEDIYYFQKKLYKALNVPLSRMEPEAGFAIGRASEISRDEIKFSRFVNRLRNRFSILFDLLLERQLLLKNIMTYDDWRKIKNDIGYDFRQDNHFEELKETEIFRERLATLREMDMIPNAIGTYYSQEWVRKNVLRQSDEEIEEIDAQIEQEPDPVPEEEAGGGNNFR